MKKNTTMKIFLIGLILFLGKTTALAQDQDIRCEVNGLDLNLSQSNPGYGIEFGSFSLFAEGEKLKEEKGAVGIAKYYKLPRTKLILSVGMGYVPSGEISSVPQLMTMMVLSKKRVPFSSNSSNPELDKFFDEITEHAVSHVQVSYPIAAFDKGGEGKFYMPFLGKKKPVAIMMTCKKVKKASL